MKQSWPLVLPNTSSWAVNLSKTIFDFMFKIYLFSNTSNCFMLESSNGVIKIPLSSFIHLD